MRRRVPDEPMFLTDGEIAVRLSLSPEEWAAAVLTLASKGLPPPDPVFRNRRYWPAVRAYLDRRAGIGKNLFPGTVDGEENWDGKYGRRPARAGA